MRATSYTMLLISIGQLAQGLIALPFTAGLLLARKWRKLLTLVMLALFVAIGLPIESRFELVMARGTEFWAKAQGTISGIRDEVNGFLFCTTPILTIINRAMAFVRGIGVLIAEDIGFIIEHDVRADATIVTISDYCTFTSSISTFATDFIGLIQDTILLLLDVLQTIIQFGDLVISNIADVADENPLEILYELIYDTIVDQIDFLECILDPPESIIFCACPGRWNTVGEMPSPFRSMIMCINTGYDGISDPILCGIGPMIKLDAIIGVINTVLSKLSVLFEDTLDNMSQVIGMLNDFDDIFSVADAICDVYDDIPSFLRPGWLKDIIDPICDLVGADTNPTRILVQTITDTINQFKATFPGSIPLTCTSTISPTDIVPIMGAVPRNVSRLPAPRSTAFVRKLVDRQLARRFGDNAERLARWTHLLTTAYDTINANATHSPRHIAALLRAGGVDAALFAPANASCPAPRVERMILSVRPPDVILDDRTAAATIFGAVVFALFLVFCVCACPGALCIAVGFIMATALGTIVIIFTNGGAQAMAAIASGRVNDVYALPTLAFAAQRIGNGYLSGDFGSFDPVVLANGLRPHLIADTNMIFSSILGAPFCALPFGWFCPPPPRRGELPFANFFGSLFCIQDQQCTKTSDCSGRAVGCYDGKCRCWGSVPDTISIPDIQVFYTDGLDCSPNGYASDVRVPFLQPGGLSFTNVQNTFGNAWRVVRDVLAAAAASNFISPGLLVVLVFLSTVPCLGRPARRAAVLVGAALATQYGLAYVQDATGWTLAEDRGVFCALVHTPSLGLWWIVAQIALPLVLGVTLSAIAAAVVATVADVVVIVLWFVGLCIRLVIPWKSVWREMGAPTQ